jgi:flagellar hook-basal body complex protein FliE
MIQGLGNLAGGGLSYAGSMAQAESKQDDAQASYESSRQQADQSFFDQLGQSIKTLLDSWKATESVTHQANSQIYNI